MDLKSQAAAKRTNRLGAVVKIINRVIERHIDNRHPHPHNWLLPASHRRVMTGPRLMPHRGPGGNPPMLFSQQHTSFCRPHITPCRAVVNGESSTWLSAPLKHVIESQQFGKDALARIFEVARQMEDVRPNTDESRQLQGAIMSTLFYEPSTRTRLSFESAMARLGGTVLSTESAGEYSSAAKGETLEGRHILNWL